MEYLQSEIDQIIEYRKSLSAPQKENKSAFEYIMEWMNDGSGSIRLSEEHQKIFDRWREIYKLKLEGITDAEIISRLTKFYEVSESTIRKDMKLLPKVFPVNFHADTEMYILYQRNVALMSRLEKSSNPKVMTLLVKLAQVQKDIITYFKGDGNLPDPEAFKRNVIIMTSNPADIGLDGDIPDVEELLKKYKSKRKIDDAEIVSDE